MRELTSRSKDISMEMRLEKLNTYLKGWIGYFRLTEVPSILQNLDEMDTQIAEDVTPKAVEEAQDQSEEPGGAGYSRRMGAINK